MRTSSNCETRGCQCRLIFLVSTFNLQPRLARAAATRRACDGSAR
jgi:hypothetical protein